MWQGWAGGTGSVSLTAPPLSQGAAAAGLRAAGSVEPLLHAREHSQFFDQHTACVLHTALNSRLPACLLVSFAGRHGVPP